MNLVALKMLVGDRTKYIAIVFGVAFATLLMAQQMAIFVGLISRTYGFIADTSLPQLWVMDPKVQFVDDLKTIQDTALLRVRGTRGVAWATPMYKGLIKARLEDGTFQNCIVIGLDDATLIGGPPEMVSGRLEDLRRADGVIIDDVAAGDKLGHVQADGSVVPVKVGETIELNDKRAIVVGICRITRSFQSQPTVYTTYSRATTLAPRERRLLTFVLVGVRPDADVGEVAKRISDTTGLGVYTQDQFEYNTVKYFLERTGIPINFGISVALGLIIGTAIAGQTFYQFTVENTRYLGALKAMGCGNWVLARMTLLQAMLVAIIGYGIGVGIASVFGFATAGGELAFRMVWQIPVLVGVAVMLICLSAAVLSLWRVVRLEPAIVFKG